MGNTEGHYKYIAVQPLSNKRVNLNNRSPACRKIKIIFFRQP